VQALQVRETATETRIELPAEILFDFDKADIRAAAEPALRQAAEVIRKGARGTVRIDGHSDGKGSPAYNQKLSERRAASVQKWLTDRAGLRSKFAAKGFGATRPVAPNVKPDGSDRPEGRQEPARGDRVRENVTSCAAPLPRAATLERLSDPGKERRAEITAGAARRYAPLIVSSPENGAQRRPNQVLKGSKL
jgi:outer membrane protein OmpA-like peptidoglycan-associated protein